MDATSPPDRSARRPAQKPRFTTGSLLHHILWMTGAGAIGLMSLFVGDLANIYFLSLLQDQVVLAAVSYASSIVVLLTYIGVGLGIAATAVVSPALGAGHRVRARRLAVNALMWAFVVSLVLGVIVWLSVPWLLDLLGAVGRTHDLATDYLRIMILGLPPVAVGITGVAVLRSTGDPRRAMLTTVAGAAVNVALDPILIFTLDLGIHGAAIASVLSRFVMLAASLYCVIKIHDLLGRPKLQRWLNDARPLAAVAIPAIATNVATPAANAYVMSVMSTFGDGAVAGWGIVGRIMPVAFGAIFALSGAVGPIIGQNFGAGDYQRMRRTLTLSLVVTCGFTIFAWIVLALAANFIVAQFRVEGEAADLIYLFCRWVNPLFVFLGALFVSNAIFNTLGRPQFSTLLNWTRATVGTVPFVLVGAHYYGAPGVLIGNMIGAIFIGLLAVAYCYRLIARLEEKGGPAT